MDNYMLASKIHNKYAGLVGSDQIATKLALRIIGEHLDIVKPRSILEIGSGIGTITDFISSKVPNSIIYCYEVNEWCLQQLRKNLKGLNIVILKSPSEFKLIQNKIDFLIIDDYLDEQTTFDLIRRTQPESIFIEGHRRKQRLDVMKAYKNIGWFFRFKNFKGSSDSCKGGVLIFHSPSVSYKQFFYFGYVRMTLLYSKVLEIRTRIPLRKLFSRN
jgi:precorrin-6B methylase 2